MEFIKSGPDIVRSDHQRWLLDYWAARSRAEPLPVWRGLDAGDIAIPFDNLAWMEVIDVNGDPRFLMKFHGSRLSEALGPIEGLGRYIDDFLPPSYLGAAIKTYVKVLSSRGPVYTVSDMRDPTGQIVHHERLLLPFTQGSTAVDRILASIEAASPEGPFEMRNLMKSPIRPPVIALCATIQY